MAKALIVSAGNNANEYLARHIGELGYTRPTIVASGGEARRRMDTNDFEVVIINTPLPDEFGHELCADAVEKTDAGVIFLAKAAAAEQLLTPLSEEGVLLVTKPFSNTFFLQAIHMAAASNHRLLLLRQENQRMQEKLWQALYYRYDFAKEYRPQLEENLLWLDGELKKLEGMQMRHRTIKKSDR